MSLTKSVQDQLVKSITGLFYIRNIKSLEVGRMASYGPVVYVWFDKPPYNMFIQITYNTSSGDSHVYIPKINLKLDGIINGYMVKNTRQFINWYCLNYEKSSYFYEQCLDKLYAIIKSNDRNNIQHHQIISVANMMVSFDCICRILDGYGSKYYVDKLNSLANTSI